MECPACQTSNIDGARFCAKCGAPLPTAKSATDPLIGAVVGGRFRVSGILGEGGMGRVYSGEQQMGTSVRRVAIKTLLAEHARDPQTVARFMRECGTVSELEHPNTIKVYDFGQTNTGELYIAMELLTGKSLEKALEDDGVLSPERVDKIVGQICGSLQEAHEKGIIHRDLKPANIQLLTRAGEDDYVKVLDFGIAKKSEATSKHDQKLTKQGTILGTPPYMSPEQFKGVELDARSDIYSLGVMAYEMLSGRLPFEADTPWQWATQHMTAQPFPFETIALTANLPQKMKSAVMRSLAKDRERRQQTVREFYEEMTLGTARMSMLGMAPSAQSAPEISSGGGTVALQSRPGGTQVGAPLYVPGAVTGAGPSAPGRTMLDSSISSAPATTPSAGSVPTGGGQAITAPGPAYPPKKSNLGLILGVVAVVVVLGGVGIVVKMKSGPTDGDAHTVALPTAPPSATVASDPVPSAVASVTSPPDAGAKPVVPVSAPVEPACGEALAAANGGNVSSAISKMQGCTNSAKRHEVAEIVGRAAQSQVSIKKCGARSVAMQAAGIGEKAALDALSRMRCP